jgi:hypothetical protein
LKSADVIIRPARPIQNPAFHKSPDQKTGRTPARNENIDGNEKGVLIPLLFGGTEARTRFGFVGVLGFFTSDKVNRNIVGAVGPVADKAQTTTFDEEGNAADDLCAAGWSKMVYTAGSGVKEPASKFHRTYFIPSILLRCQQQRRLYEDDFIMAIE